MPHEPIVDPDEVLADCMRRIDAGEAFDLDALCERHPEAADELRSYFAAASEIERLAGPAVATDRLQGAETLVPDGGEPDGGEPDPIAARDTETNAVAESRRNRSDAVPATSSGIGEQFGRYRIVKTLGEGAMGAVYLAFDTDLNRKVALKLPKFSGDDPEMIERFRTEARAAANLRHSGICPVFDVGEIDGRQFITMAYIPGRPLSDYAKSKTDQPVRQVVKVLRKLCLALYAAHESGVVHRDVKPANIMIDKTGEPVVMDFGLARQTTSTDVRLTRSGAIMGTPAFMSPEQVEGRIDDVGPKSDQFSLGGVLYEMLTGRLPFEGSSVAVVMSRILNEPAQPPSALRPEVDADLDAICQRMLSRDVADRYESLKDVADELTNWLRRNKQGTSGDELADPRATAAFVHPTSTDGVESPDAATVSSPHLKSVASSAETAANAGVPTIVVDDEDRGPHLATVRRRRSRGNSPTKPPWKWIAAGVGGSALLLLGLVFLLRAPEGTLRVEVEEGADVEVLVDGQQISLTDSRWQDDVKAAEHRLTLMVNGATIPFNAKSRSFVADGRRIKVDLSGLELRSERFEVARNGTTVLRITLEQDHASIRPDVLTAKDTDVRSRPSEWTPPPGTTRIGETFFKVIPAALSWHAARRRCEELGGQLGTIETATQNDEVVDLMKKAGVRQAWLGATDEETEGQWTWVDGSRIDYANWGPDQPGNADGGENYMVILSYRPYPQYEPGNWCDLKGSASREEYGKAGFLCEWTPPKLLRPAVAALAPPTEKPVVVHDGWAYGESRRLELPFEEEDLSEGDPTTDARGLTMVLHRDGPRDDLWLTERESIDQSWPKAVRLPDPINSKDHDGSPVLSADGLVLVFSTNRFGDDERAVFIARRERRGAPWGEPEQAEYGIGGHPLALTNGGRRLFYEPSTYAPTRIADWDDEIGGFRDDRNDETEGLGKAALRCFSDDELVHVYTAVEPEKKWFIRVQRRASKNVPWGPPVDVLRVGGWISRPQLTSDGRAILYSRYVRTRKPNPETGKVDYQSDIFVIPCWPADGKVDTGTPGMPGSPGTRAGESRTFTDLEIPFQWCPPGTFTMGSAPDSPETRPADQKPVPVTLGRGFWMSRTEVTQKTWEAVMATRPWTGGKYADDGSNTDYPATLFSWHDAVEFCDRLTKRERDAGRLPSDWRYTLPTEAQWEYACRAGTTTRYSFGDDTSRLPVHAWWGGVLGEGNTKRDKGLHAVATKLPNPWGLYDMHGNVWEICLDDFSRQNPGGRDPIVSNGGSFRVKKGGSWSYAAVDCRSSARKAQDQFGRFDGTGIRLALGPIDGDAVDDGPLPRGESPRSPSVVAAASSVVVPRVLVLDHGVRQHVSADISPDGEWIVTKCQGRARLWSTRDGQEVDTTIPGRTHAATWLTDSRTIVCTTLGFDDEGRRVQFHPLETPNIVTREWEIPHSDVAVGLAISPDGKRLLIGAWDQSVTLWDIESKKLLHRLEFDAGRLDTVAFSPDGTEFYVYCPALSDHNATLTVCDAGTGERKREFQLSSHGKEFAAISADGRFLLMGEWALSSLILVDVRTGETVADWNNGAPAGGVALSHDGMYALTGGLDGVVRLWNVRDRELVESFAGHTDLVKSVAFGPGSTFAVSGSKDGTARIWPLPPLDADAPDETGDPESNVADSDRGVVERIIGLGGSVRVKDGNRRYLTHVDHLPEGAFRVDGVSFLGPDARVGDADIALLQELPELENLYFGPVEVTDAGFARLAALDGVKLLNFVKSPLGDRGLAALVGMKKLEQLELYHTDVTDAGLRVLGKFPSLQRLTIGHGRKPKFGPHFITDAGLAHLPAIEKLDKLWVYGSVFTDACIDHLVACPELRFLMLATPNVSDEAYDRMHGHLVGGKIYDKRGDPEEDR